MPRYPKRATKAQVAYNILRNKASKRRISYAQAKRTRARLHALNPRRRAKPYTRPPKKGFDPGYDLQTLRHMVFGPPAAAAAPQGFNFSKWGGRTTTSFPKLTSGSASTPSGIMVVRSSPESIAATLRNYPHDCFMKFYFSSNSLDSTVGSLTKGSIGYLDRVYSASTKDAQHLSWMVLELSRSQELWWNRAIGNSAALAADSTVGMTYSNQSPWVKSTSTSSEWPAAHTPMMLTCDRIPLSGDQSFQALLDHKHHIASQAPVLAPESGEETTTLKSGTTVADHTHLSGQALGDTGGAADTQTNAGLKWEVPNHVVSGIDIDLNFNSASVVDQYLTVKLCRLVEQSAQPFAMTVSQRQELLNKQTVTDSDMYETVYQHSFFMPRMTSFQSLKNRTFRVEKFIKTNYARSRTRMVSTASLDTTAYGAMHSPQWTQGTKGEMYNNLSLVISSRVVDEHYVAKDEFESGNKMFDPNSGQLGFNSTTIEQANLKLLNLDTTSANKQLSTGFAKFGVSGSVTQRFRVKDYTSPVHSIAI